MMFLRTRLAVATAALAAMSASADAQAIITNGVIRLGVQTQGHLNFAGVGLRFIDGSGFQYESTYGGCQCEGWGVGSRVGGIVTSWGGANEDVGGRTNLTNVAFTSTASTAISTVRLTTGATLTITHEYKPSSVPNLFEVNVTISNTGSDAINDVVYRRVMDWDIDPTEFEENVRISGWGATNLIGSGSNGFLSAEPLSGLNACVIGGICNADFETTDSDDRGAFFDFSFGMLGAGQTRSFQTFYGAADNLAGLLTALGAVGAEVYSAAWCAGDNPACAGISGPAVFGYGFKGVGGVPNPDLPPSTVVPEPSTYVMLAAGLLGLAGVRRRRTMA